MREGCQIYRYTSLSFVVLLKLRYAARYIISLQSRLPSGSVRCVDLMVGVEWVEVLGAAGSEDYVHLLADDTTDACRWDASSS